MTYTIHAPSGKTLYIDGPPGQYLEAERRVREENPQEWEPRTGAGPLAPRLAPAARQAPPEVGKEQRAAALTPAAKAESAREQEGVAKFMAEVAGGALVGALPLGGLALLGRLPTRFLGRMATQIGTGAAQGAATDVIGGRDPSSGALMGGALGGAFQGAAEIPIAIARLRRGIQEGRRLKAAYERAVQEGKTTHAQAQADYAAQILSMTNQYKAQDRAALERWHTESAAQEQAFQAELTRSAAEGAGGLMAKLKDHVPAWRDIPATQSGLARAVYGDGPELASAEFEKAWTDVIGRARGRPIVVSSETARALRLRGRPPKPDEGSPPVAEAVRQGDEGVAVDAAHALRRATGKSRTAPEAYREVADAIEELGIANPDAWAAYKWARGSRDYIDKVQAIGKKGEFFNAGAIADGLTQDVSLNLLRGRTMGHLLEGPFSEVPVPPTAPLAPPRPLPSARLFPPKPPEAAMPPTPPPTPPVKEFEIPRYVRWAAPGGLLAAAGAGAGMPMSHWGPAAILAGIMGEAYLPRSLAIASLPPEMLQQIAKYPTLLAALLKGGSIPLTGQ